MGKGIPERWLPYSAMGSIIPGTRFIACKVPLKDALLQELPEKERFGPKHLLDAFPKVGLLIDLTNTTRYYSKLDFTDKNIRYEKIFCPGKVIPPNSIVKQFFNVVDDYLATETDPDTVIAVHCTHGVNRTGYFICRYMIERLNISPEEAVRNFQSARGHDIERENFVNDLKNGCKGGSEADLCFVQNRGFGRGRHRGDRRQGNNLRRRSYDGFDDGASNRRDEISEKRSRNHAGRRDSSKHPYFNNVDRRRNQEEDSKYNYNWRNHGMNSNASSPSTTALPQFTPHHQGSRSLYIPPVPPSREHPPPADYPMFDDAGYPLKKQFPGPSIKRSSGDSGWRHNPTPNEATQASISKGQSFFSKNEPYFPKGRRPEMLNPGFREHFQPRGGMAGGGRGRGRGGDWEHSGGRGNSSGRRNWRRGNGPQRGNYSR